VTLPLLLLQSQYDFLFILWHQKTFPVSFLKISPFFPFHIKMFSQWIDAYFARVYITRVTFWSQSYQTFFFVKRRFFFHFSLLSWSVCSIWKYCLYFKMAKLKSKNWKNEEIKVWYDCLQENLWCFPSCFLHYFGSHMVKTVNRKNLNNKGRLYIYFFHNYVELALVGSFLVKMFSWWLDACFAKFYITTTLT
jgi:hypothetical protein